MALPSKRLSRRRRCFVYSQLIDECPPKSALVRLPHLLRNVRALGILSDARLRPGASDARDAGATGTRASPIGAESNLIARRAT